MSGLCSIYRVYCGLIRGAAKELSKQHASVSQGRICSDNCACCHTEIEAGDQRFYLTQSQHTDPWQGSHWCQLLSDWYDSVPVVK